MKNNTLITIIAVTCLIIMGFVIYDSSPAVSYRVGKKMEAARLAEEAKLLKQAEAESQDGAKIVYMHSLYYKGKDGTLLWIEMSHNDSRKQIEIEVKEPHKDLPFSKKAEYYQSIADSVYKVVFNIK